MCATIQLHPTMVGQKHWCFLLDYLMWALGKLLMQQRCLSSAMKGYDSCAVFMWSTVYHRWTPIWRCFSPHCKSVEHLCNLQHHLGQCHSRHVTSCSISAWLQWPDSITAHSTWFVVLRFTFYLHPLIFIVLSTWMYICCANIWIMIYRILNEAWL